MSGFLLLLVKVNLVMGAAIILVSLIRRPLRAQFGAPIAYAIWLLVPLASLASVLPPREVSAPAHIASVQAPEAPAPVAGYVPPSILNAIEQPIRQSVLIPTAPVKPSGSLYEVFDISQMLFSAWVLGLLFMAAYLARVQIRFSDAVRRGQAGPAVLGFLRPRIVTPGGFQEQFTPQEQSAILAHESVHLARQDARINALVAFVRCLCWFNPLIHLGARRLRIDQELACDAIAVSASVSRQAYAKALLKSQVMVGVLPFGCNWPGPQHPLVERIALLQRKPPGTARRLVGMCLVLLTATSAGLGAWAAQPPVAAKSMAAEQSSMALTMLPAIRAARDQTTGTAGAGQPVAPANPTGSGNDVDASKNIRANRAVSGAPVAHTQAKATPNPVMTTNAQGSAEQALPPTIESSTAALPTGQVAINQAARQAIQIKEAATTSADPTTRSPAAPVATTSDDHPIALASAAAPGPSGPRARTELALRCWLGLVGYKGCWKSDGCNGGAAVKTVEYLGINGAGADVYQVRYMSGIAAYVVTPDPQGTTDQYLVKATDPYWAKREISPRAPPTLIYTKPGNAPAARCLGPTYDGGPW